MTAARTLYSSRSHRRFFITSMSGCSVAHIGLVNIQRREAETHDIRRAKISDDPAGNQRLHGRIAIFKGKGDLAATF